MKISFQLATEELIPEITEMMDEFYAIDKYPFDAKIAKKNLIEFINNAELGRFWIIFSDNKIAGYLAFTFGFSFEYKGRDAFIDELFFKKAFRNKGIGKVTLEFVNQQAKILGVNATHLEVEKHNEKGNRLYLKHGFEGNERILLTKLTR